MINGKTLFEVGEENFLVEIDFGISIYEYRQRVHELIVSWGDINLQKKGLDFFLARQKVKFGLATLQ